MASSRKSKSAKPMVDRNLGLEMVRVTEAAAIAAAGHLGQGDEQKVDLAAARAMRKAIGRLSMGVTVVFADGDEGGNPPLPAGTLLGTKGDPEMDIAALPVEGSSIVARGGVNAISVAVMAPSDSILPVPDIYMEKIAVGSHFGDVALDLDAPPADLLKCLAKAKETEIDKITACVLDRPRHGALIAALREAGARVILIDDGDVSGAVATGWHETEIDVYLGTGGAREGVLAGAALLCLGGRMIGRLVPRDRDEEEAAKTAGFTDLTKIYTETDMAGADVAFAATGITNGTVLSGVRHWDSVAITQSVCLRSASRTRRFVETHHDLLHKKF
ncbi:MAG: class II fructose-bisphosphatase [Magnetospiraceae bacterium]